MTDYIQKLLQRFVVEKDQKQYRLDPEDPYREAEQYRAEGLNDLRRSVRRLESVLSRETPHVYPDERLALIRTVTTIPEIFTKEEAEALRKTHYIHEQGKVCNLNPDYRMLLMGFDRKREEIRQIRESGCTEEHGEYLDAMEEVMNLIQEFADRYRQAAVEAGNQVVAKAGPGTRQYQPGDRVIVYHISGCGVCYNCRMGYAVACTSPARQAYGWQRNGGMAPYILCDEKDLIALPDELTYKDGASVACGFGTAYEALEKIGISGNDAVLVVGLGPVGLATLMLCKAMGAEKLIGVEMNEYRIEMAKKLGLVDYALKPSDTTVQEILDLTGGHGVERAIDCSASDPGRQTAVRATRDWGKVALVGEGNTMSLNPSPDLMHSQKTVYGSWVTSTWKMMDLVEHLVRWNIHPGDLITDEFPVERAGEAYALMASGKCGKVAVVFPEEGQYCLHFPPAGGNF